MMEWIGVVLAAGEGRRMNSKVPKVLHKVCGRPMISHAVDALKQAGVARVLVVVSPENDDAVRTQLADSVEYVVQPRPLGTGHALLQCADFADIPDANVLVSMGDAPLVRSNTLSDLKARHIKSNAALTFLTARGSAQKDLGRVRRNSEGRIIGVVEASDAGYEDLANEVNAGVYCFDGSWLSSNLPRIPTSNNGEQYLTWLIGEAAEQGKTVNALTINDPEEAMGVNDRISLAAAEAALRRRISNKWMRAGVTIIDPPSTFIDANAFIGRDSVVHPNSHITGNSTIGEDCEIGPGALLQDATIGSRCRVTLSVVEDSILEDDVNVGPYSHLRPGCHVEAGAHIGNFVEVKASRLGRGVKLGHFGYVGDAQVGANANLGAGMVTCNFDGVRKHRTIIGEGAFIGSDTMLVAPVSVGNGSVTGAGSVVNRDVPPYRLALGVPARIRERPSDRKVGDNTENSPKGSAC